MAKSKKLPNRVEKPSDLWTKQRIHALAPDEASVPAAQKVLKKGGFGTVEATADGKGWWVVCRGITDTYQTSARVSSGTFLCSCTCPSPKYPCKHALALLLYLLDHPEERAEPEAPKSAATDFEALVRAVFQNPGDDTPRLVFADFLEENDQPDRAALIRVQCSLAREKARSPRASELRKDEKRLLAKEQEQVGTLPEGVEADFRRGFLHLTLTLHSLREVGSLPERFTRLFRDGWVEVVSVDGYYFDRMTGEHATLLSLVGELDFSDYHMNEEGLVALVAHAADMKSTGRLCRVKVAKRDQKAYDALVAAQAGEEAAAPSGRMEEHREFRGLTPQTFDLLVRAGRLRSARQITLDGPLGNAEAERLAAVDLTGVEGLHLGDWRLTPEGVAALANAAGLSGLESFGLFNTRLEPGHLAALANGSGLAGLRRLHLGTAELNDASLAELATAEHFRELLTLDLESNELTPMGLADFLQARGFPAITVIRLNDNRIGFPDLLPLLIGAAERPGLALIFSGVTSQRWCGKAGVQIGVTANAGTRDDLFTGLKAGAMRAVTSFSASGVAPSQQALRALAQALSPDMLQEFSLRNVVLKNGGAEELVPAFRDFRPQTLRLQHCRIQASGVAALADSPLLTGVKVLDLSGNTVGKAGVAALVKSPHLGNLEKLELSAERLGADEKKALKKKFGTKLVL